MRAGVLLPPSYATSKLRYPVIYRVRGFGGSYRSAWTSGAVLCKKMADKKLPEMISIYLDGVCPMGHHEFADSVNNGPWGYALTSRVIFSASNEMKFFRGLSMSSSHASLVSMADRTSRSKLFSVRVVKMDGRCGYSIEILEQSIRKCKRRGSVTTFRVY